MAFFLKLQRKLPMESEKVDVNRHIGARLRLLRGKLRLSLKRVGAWLNVSHQQVGNYEDGTNRLTADALFVLSRKMNVDPSFFFEGLFDPHSNHSLADPAAADYLVEPSSFPESSRLDGAFARIRSKQQRLLAVRLVEAVAETEAGGAPREHSGGQRSD